MNSCSTSTINRPCIIIFSQAAQTSLRLLISQKSWLIQTNDVNERPVNILSNTLDVANLKKCRCYGRFFVFFSTGFHIADYVIFAGVLVVSTSIGLYHAFTGGKQRTTKEYFMANRKLSTLPVAASILVSFISAITVLGTPAEMYTRGTQMFMRTIGYCLSLLVSSLMFVPLFFPLKITSSFEVILLCFLLPPANEF